LYAVLTTERKDAPRVLTDCVIPSQWDSDLHVLPACSLLDSAERELIGVAGAPYRLADPLSRILSYYAAVVIDTRPSFSLLTEMALLAATDAIVPVEPRYLETVGLLSVLNKINDIREGWRHLHLHVRGLLVTKMDGRIRGHTQLLDDLKAHTVLGPLLCGVIPANEAVSYSHHHHLSIFSYDPRSAASKAYLQVAASLVRQMLARRTS
jgi:chromosome partitioning protein